MVHTGDVGSHQVGGILRADGAGRVVDLRYEPTYEERFADYKKLVGSPRWGRESRSSTIGCS